MAVHGRPSRGLASRWTGISPSPGHTHASCQPSATAREALSG
ncbi:hypothetical protein ppKF707_1122 [Metapseudomonas furukawaii]|uniref:Uncharacterized protein n=1 Tax=Metapseudomonas furukawaii TaxID=1149133 RepID=A0AAD1FII8_METFU|nr:hypothetical protein ppKF707_1122 [Pseudomonas furukawaii]BAU76678.1 hypothetical protein KF707C_49900 [Pseudomonas furukawaii]